MRLQRGVEALPKLDILDRLLVGGAPAVALPAVDPARDPLPDILAVGVDLGGRRIIKKVARRDRRPPLPLVVGGVTRAAAPLLLLVAELQDGALAAGPGISRARAVGLDRDDGELAHATSPDGISP